jgi:hypothetical protein
MRSVFLLVLTSFLVAACGTNKKNVSFEIQLNYDNVPHLVGDVIFKSDTAVQFDLFHLYLSNLTLGNTLAEEVLFINAMDSSSLNYTISLPRKVSMLSFGLGVDSIQNSMDPTTFSTSHPLSSANAMYWSWASKYRFLKVDGKVNPTGSIGVDDDFLVWHTGTNSLYRTAMFEQDIRPGDHVILKIDLNVLLSSLSLKDDLFTHAGVDTYAIAEKVTETLISAMALEIQ